MSLFEEANNFLYGVLAESKIIELGSKVGELVLNQFLGETVLGHLFKDVGVFTYHAINYMINLMT